MRVYQSVLLGVGPAVVLHHAEHGGVSPIRADRSSNGLWFTFPVVGFWASVRTILDDSLAIFL